MGVVVVLGGVALVMVRAWSAFAESPLRRALPAGAADVREQSMDLLPDHAYCLRARVDAAELAAYAARVGMTPHTPSRRYGDDPMWLAWPGICTAPWWDPSDDLGATWVAQSGRVWTYAKHENGWLYVKSVGH